jgi:hypothetical protein
MAAGPAPGRRHPAAPRGVRRRPGGAQDRLLAAATHRTVRNTLRQEPGIAVDLA